MKIFVAGSCVVLVAMAIGCSEKKKPAAEQAKKAEPAAAEVREKPSLQKTDPPVPTREAEDEELRGKRAKYRSKQLAAYDKDGDGVFSPEERQAMVEQRIEKTFGELDKNGDDRLGKHELQASDARMARRLERRFDKLDADGDGVLTREETKKLMTGRRFGPGAGNKAAPGGSAAGQ